MDKKEQNTLNAELGKEDKDINITALSNSDDDSLTKALSSNPFKLFFVRNFIKIKNHIYTIPMLMSIVCMCVITFTISPSVNAIVLLHNSTMNAFYYFINVVLSLIVVLLYLNVSSKKVSKKKRIIFSVLFFLAVGAEIFLDYYHLHDINVETNLYNSVNKVVDDATNHYIAKTQKYTSAHLICLYILTGLAILAPIVQPFTKKLHLNINNGKKQEKPAAK
jgi:hypothetical protein